MRKNYSYSRLASKPKNKTNRFEIYCASGEILHIRPESGSANSEVQGLSERKDHEILRMQEKRMSLPGPPGEGLQALWSTDTYVRFYVKDMG